jgi:hypothetical protein
MRAVGRSAFGDWGMTKFRLPNDLEDLEARALIEILCRHASTLDRAWK